MRLLRLLALGAAGVGAADAAEAQGGGFLFDTSGERPLTMPFRLNVGLLGFGTDQLQSRANLDAVEIESALMVSDAHARAPAASLPGAILSSWTVRLPATRPPVRCARRPRCRFVPRTRCSLATT